MYTKSKCYMKMRAGKLRMRENDKQERRKAE